MILILRSFLVTFNEISWLRLRVYLLLLNLKPAANLLLNTTCIYYMRKASTIVDFNLLPIYSNITTSVQLFS